MPAKAESFIARWSQAEASERANAQQFLLELADLLGVPRPSNTHSDGLTLTGIYNVLEALRAGRELTPKEQTIHDNGLVSVLRQLHDDLDAAVADAYGWSGSAGVPPASTKSSGQDAHAPGDAEILRRLVALNAERAAEEALANTPATPADIAKRFSRAKESDIGEILETLATLGRVTKNGVRFNK